MTNNTNNPKPVERSDITRAFNQAESQTVTFARCIEEGHGEWIAEEATERRMQNPSWRPAVQIMQLRRMPRDKDAPIVTLAWDKEAKRYTLANAKARAPRADKDLDAELVKLIEGYGLKTVMEHMDKLIKTYTTKAA